MDRTHPDSGQVDPDWFARFFAAGRTPARPPEQVPAARVNREGFLVECGDLPLAPGSALYLHRPSPRLAPVEARQVLRSVLALGAGCPSTKAFTRGG